MAYFRKRGKTWSFTIDGKEKGGFRTKKDAEMAATKMQLEIDTGMYIQPSEITFKDYAENVWLPVYSKSVKPGSVRVRRHELDALITVFGTDTKIQNITAAYYSKTVSSLFDKFAYNTACGMSGTGKMIFKKAFADDVIKKNPAENFRIPRKVLTIEEINTEDVPKFLEKEELAKFLKTALKNGLDDDFLMFRILAYTGLRIGELCALKWSDVDFKNATLSVLKTYYNPSNTHDCYELVTPKTKSSKRKVDLDPETIKLLKEHKLQQRFSMAQCLSWHDKDFVFTHLDYPGYPKYPKLIGYRMKRILIAACLPQTLSPHSLRHTHCSLLAEAGASLEEIQARLGQVDDDTTKKVYLHITKARKKDTMQKFTQLMQGVL